MLPRVLLIVLFACALLFSTALSAQPDASIPHGVAGEDFNVTDAEGLKQGHWVKVYQNGTIYYKGAFTNDTPIGTFWFWYDSGEPMREVDHLDGTKHMVATHFHTNGKIMSKGHYREGKDPTTGEPDKLRDGEWEFFGENGLLRSKEHYRLGQKHGAATSYYDSGKLLREEHYSNGKKEGKFIEYFENGRIHALREHANNTFHGETMVYESDGSFIMKGNYVNGKRDGIWIFFEDGRIRLTTKFDNGKEVSTRRENGEFIDYYANGIPKASYTYENGKRNGPFTEWHEMGEWVREPMDMPAPGGGIQFREKLINTQVKCEGDYLDDQPEGAMTWYDVRGKILKIEDYVNGDLVTTRMK